MSISSSSPSLTKDILLDRYRKVCERTSEDFSINKVHHLWKEDFENIPSVFRHGTLSLGFIGLSEAIEVLSGRLEAKGRLPYHVELP